MRAYMLSAPASDSSVSISVAAIQLLRSFAGLRDLSMLDHRLGLLYQTTAVRSHVHIDLVAEDLTHLFNGLASRFWHVQVDQYLTDEAEAHEDEVHLPSSVQAVSRQMHSLGDEA
jgi:hypothetical protein